MKFALSLNISEDGLTVAPILRKISNELEEYFLTKNYGKSFDEIYIGIVCVNPKYDPFFQPRGLRFLRKKKVAEWDVKLDFKIMLSIEETDRIQLVTREIIASFSNLNFGKRDFNFNKFKTDFKEFFKEES